MYARGIYLTSKPRQLERADVNKLNGDKMISLIFENSCLSVIVH